MGILDPLVHTTTVRFSDAAWAGLVAEAQRSGTSAAGCPWMGPVLRTCVRVDQRGTYARFRRALDTGNLTLVRAAAAELPRISLDDALRICLLLRGADPTHFERAVVRWLGRWCLERPDVTLSELRLALAAFERLPDELDDAAAELRRLVWR